MKEFRKRTGDEALDLLIRPINWGTAEPDNGRDGLEIEVRLSPELGFWKRIAAAARYLFGRRCVYGDYVETELVGEDAKGLWEVWKDAGIYDRGAAAPDLENGDALLLMCDCGSPDHNAIAAPWDRDAVYFEMKLNRLPFWDRFRAAFNYIVKPDLDICFFDGILLSGGRAAARANEMLQLVMRCKEEGEEQ